MKHETLLIRRQFTASFQVVFLGCGIPDCVPKTYYVWIAPRLILPPLLDSILNSGNSIHDGLNTWLGTLQRLLTMG